MGVELARLAEDARVAQQSRYLLLGASSLEHEHDLVAENVVTLDDPMMPMDSKVL